MSNTKSNLAIPVFLTLSMALATTASSLASEKPVTLKPGWRYSISGHLRILQVAQSGTMPLPPRPMAFLVDLEKPYQEADPAGQTPFRPVKKVPIMGVDIALLETVPAQAKVTVRGTWENIFYAQATLPVEPQPRTALIARKVIVDGSPLEPVVGGERLLRLARERVLEYLRARDAHIADGDEPVLESASVVAPGTARVDVSYVSGWGHVPTARRESFLYEASTDEVSPADPIQ